MIRTKKQTKIHAFTLLLRWRQPAVNSRDDLLHSHTRPIPGPDYSSFEASLVEPFKVRSQYVTDLNSPDPDHVTRQAVSSSPLPSDSQRIPFMEDCSRSLEIISDRRTSGREDKWSMFFLNGFVGFVFEKKKNQSNEKLGCPRGGGTFGEYNKCRGGIKNLFERWYADDLVRER